MSDRARLGVTRITMRTPVHPSHRVALVGEAVGPGFTNPHGDPQLAEHCALYPHPERSAAGRLRTLLGLSRQQYLDAFARVNLLPAYPGPAFPVARARPLAEPLCARLAPRPLILLGQGVAMAFQFPRDQGTLSWVSYRLGDTLCCAAVVPHPSGRNLWYNDGANRARARAFILQSLTDLGVDLK